MQNKENLNLQNTISSKKIEKTVGETRHYSPASIEWRNSIYAYNKNTVKSLASKDKMANNILRSYLNFIPLSPNNTKSKRMRDLIRRNTTTKLFVSKPEIKHTSRKVIVTAYTANRENHLLMRKISFFNRSLDTKTLLALGNIFEKDMKIQKFQDEIVTFRDKENTTYVHDLGINAETLENSFENKTRDIVKKLKLRNLARFSLIDIRKEKLLSKRAKRIKRRFSKPLVSKSSQGRGGLKVKVKNTLFKNDYHKTLLTSIIRKQNSLKNMFFYCFMKWTLSMFNIQVRLFQENPSPKKLFTASKLSYYIVINKAMCYKALRIKKGKFSLEKGNIMLLQLLVVTLKKALSNISSPISLEKWVYFLFKYFKASYYKKFVKKYLKKEILAFHHLFMLSLNKFKFEKFLPGVKLLMAKIYNKKVEINFVNLKYLQLNSDIFAESVAIKLRNKKLGLLRVLRSAIKLVKTPKKLSSNNLNIDREKLNNSNPDIPQIVFKEKLNVFLDKMYPTTLTGNRFDLSKNSFSKLDLNLENLESDSLLISSSSKNLSWEAKKLKVLNSLKYKWITGARLEGKGRLTRRFTAARSLFKFKHKGNLKYMDFNAWNAENSVDYTKKTPKTIMLRNQIKPNIQYTFVNSKRRIGAFGIKGWISSN